MSAPDKKKNIFPVTSIGQCEGQGAIITYITLLAKEKIDPGIDPGQQCSVDAGIKQKIALMAIYS